MGTGTAQGASPQAAGSGTLQAAAVVLVNHNSTYYGDFQHYLQPYLDHFGVPYTLLDLASQAIGAEISTNALIIIGHRQLDRSLAYLSPTEQGYLAAAVNGGTGLVNFDNDLASAGSPRYSFIQDIFGFGYNSATSGSGVSFITVDQAQRLSIDSAAGDPLDPLEAASTGMHYITERHQPGETIPTASMTLAGISLPAGVDTLALTGSQPFLAAATHGLGRAVQWGTYDWMSHAVKGPVYGLDDLVWRSLVWAARKPFVLQGLPNFVTMRVDDVSGPFGWIEVANEFGLKPWAGLFYLDIDFMEARQLSTLVNGGNATAAVHAMGELTFFYYDHGAGDFPDSVVAEYFASASSWHATHNIPISRFVLPHFYEFGTNVFQGLHDWGVAFVGTLMEPGSGYYSPWIMNGPYRLYETGESNTELPTFYADFMTVPGHPEFNGEFFNCVTEIRDDAGYEWFPDNDVPGSIGRGVRQTRRALDSMALATLFTHGYYIQDITTTNWRAILQGVTAELAAYDPVYITLDDACQYLRALHTSQILSSSYDPEGVVLTTVLSGESDIPTWFHLFSDVGGEIEGVLVEVPVFSGSTEVIYPLSGALDHITLAPSLAVVAAGGRQQFSATGYDSEGNPIPGLPFHWDVVHGGGTIDANGLFTAGLEAGSYPDTIQASLWGLTGTAAVEIFTPILHHFTIEPIGGAVFANTLFQVTITARDSAENLVMTYDGQAALSDTTGSISPGASGTFSSGSWTGGVSIGQAAHQVAITATDGQVTGSSNVFEVLPLPDDYQVTSPAYRQLPGEPFLVTVTASGSGLTAGEGVSILEALAPPGIAFWDRIEPGEGLDSRLPVPEDEPSSPQALIRITMSSSSATMVFDGDGDGIFGEPGDNTRFMLGGTFNIMARDSTPGSAVSIVATDALGRYGYNLYTILLITYLPGMSAGEAH